MHDPVHDRLMVIRMAYFRIKRRWLGPHYRDFLTRVLPPHRTIVIVDCRLRRPVTRVGAQHTYQVGGLGATTVDEYLHGGPRVARFREEQGAAIRAWRPPAPTEVAPEAEWGYDAEWDDEILESLLAPRHVLRSGAIPFWLPFNTEPGDAALEHYVATRGPFREVYLMLLSNGVNAIGLVPIERWKAILRQATEVGRLLGVDEKEFPRDFASLVRYHTDLKRYVRARVPESDPIPIEELDAIAAEVLNSSHAAHVRWERHAA